MEFREDDVIQAWLDSAESELARTEQRLKTRSTSPERTRLEHTRGELEIIVKGLKTLQKFRSREDEGPAVEWPPRDALGRFLSWDPLLWHE
jgi:hypothetical protein